MTSPEAAAPAVPVARPRLRIPDRHLPSLAMVAAAILWGSAPVVTKVALESLTPFVLSSVRWTLSLAVLAVVLRRSGARPVLDRRIAGAALFGMVAFTVLFSYGVQRTSAANTTLIHAAAPMLIALLAAAFLGETISRAGGVGIALSIAGVGVIVGGATLGGSLLGNVLVAGSVLCWAIFTVLNRRIVVGRNPLAVTAGTAMFGLVLFIPAAGVELATTDQVAVGWGPVATTVYLALGPSLSAYLLYGFALSRLPAGRVAVWGNLGPVVGIAAAAIALGEPLTRLHLAGGALVFAGVWISNRRDRSDTRGESIGAATVARE